MAKVVSRASITRVPLLGARTSGATVHLFAAIKPSLLKDGATTAWIHCAREGEWKGHSAGEFEFTRNVFKRIVRNFKRQSNPSVLTYEHPEHVGKDGLAAGWIRALDVRDGDDGKADLWAFVEFTPTAAEHVRKGEYRFCSVVVDFESVDRESGETVGAELHEIGLTNIPFIDGLKPIQLSRRAASSINRSLSMATSIKEALTKAAEELPEDASIEDAMKFIKGVKAQEEAVDGEGEMEAAQDDEERRSAQDDDEEEEVEASQPAPDSSVEASEEPQTELQDPDVAEGQAAEFLNALASDLGVDVAGLLAMLSEQRDAIAQLLSGTLGEPAPMSNADNVRAVAASRVAALKKQVLDKDADIKKLSKRLEDLELSQREREVDDAIGEGLFLSKDRDRLVKLARSDYKLFQEWRKDAKESPAVPTGTRVVQAGPGSRGSGEDDGSDIDPAELRPYEQAFRALYRNDSKKVRAEAVKAYRQFQAGKPARA